MFNHNRAKYTTIRRIASAILLVSFIVTSSDAAFALAPAGRIGDKNFQKAYEIVDSNTRTFNAIGESLYLKMPVDGVRKLINRRVGSKVSLTVDRIEAGTIFFSLRSPDGSIKYFRCFLSTDETAPHGSIRLPLSRGKTYYRQELSARGKTPEEFDAIRTILDAVETAKVKEPAVILADQLMRNAVLDGRGNLYEYEVYEILKKIGIPVPEYDLIWKGGAAPNGLLAKSEYVLKVITRDMHKSDKRSDDGTKGVNIVRGKDVAAMAKKMFEIPGAEGVMIYPCADKAGQFSEMLLGLADTVNGRLVCFGYGGVYAEYKPFEDRAYMDYRMPFSAEELVRSTEIGRNFIYGAYRKERLPLDPVELTSIIDKLVNFKKRYDDQGKFDISELNINPLMCAKDGTLSCRDGTLTFIWKSLPPRVHNYKRLKGLMHPKSIAVVGASPKGQIERLMANLVDSLRQGGFEKLYLVNPERADNYENYCNLDYTTKEPDDADIYIVCPKAAKAAEIAKRLLKNGKRVVVLADGFGEGAGEGRELASELKKAAAEAPEGALLLGVNTMGHVAPNLRATFAGKSSGMNVSDASNIALICQSGGLTASSISDLILRHGSVKYGVPVGDVFDVGFADMLEYILEEEPGIKVVGGYIEGLKDYHEAGRLLELIARARKKGVTVIMRKGGFTDAGAKAILGHTGSKAGKYEHFKAVFERAGAIVTSKVRLWIDIINTASVLSEYPNGIPKNNRVFAFFTGGEDAGTTGDTAAELKRSVRMPQPGPELAGLFKKFKEQESGGLNISGKNPLDITGAAVFNSHIAPLLKHLMDSPDYDAIVIGYLQWVYRDEANENFLRFVEGLPRTKPIIFANKDNSPDGIAIKERLRKAGFVVFDYPEDCVPVLSALFPQNDAVDVKPETGVPEPEVSDSDVADLRLEPRDGEMDVPYEKEQQMARIAAAWTRENPGAYPGNPYGTEDNIRRNFSDIDGQYLHDISDELSDRTDPYHSKKQKGLPVKMLVIGVGRGLEVFQLMDSYTNKIEITSTSKEDLIYRTPEELMNNFSGHLTREEAQAYIDRLRQRYLRCNLDDGIQAEDGYFDVVLIDEFTLGYVKDKYRAIREMLRVCRDGGVVYCSPKFAHILDQENDLTFGGYFAKLKHTEVDSLVMEDLGRVPRERRTSDWLKITKKPGMVLPELELIKSELVSIAHGGKIIDVPVWRTYYRAMPSPASYAEKIRMVNSVSITQEERQSLALFLVKHVFREGEDDKPEHNLKTGEARIERMERTATDGFIAAFHKEKPVGIISYSIRGHAPDARYDSCVNDLFVDPDYQNKGIGKALLKQAAIAMAVKGAKTMASIVGSNDSAQGIWRSVSAEQYLVRDARGSIVEAVIPLKVILSTDAPEGLRGTDASSALYAPPVSVRAKLRYDGPLGMHVRPLVVFQDLLRSVMDFCDISVSTEDGKRVVSTMQRPYRIKDQSELMINVSSKIEGVPVESLKKAADIVKGYLEDRRVSQELEKELGEDDIDKDVPGTNEKHYRYKYFKMLRALFHRDGDSGDLISPVSREVAQAEMLANHIKILASEAKREKAKVIIGIETAGWMPDEQKSDMQALASEVRQFVDTMKRRGMLDNIAVVLGNSETLLTNIVNEKTGKSDKVVVLGSEKTLTSDNYKSLEAFKACIDLRQLGNFDYISLLEVLTVALNLGLGGDTQDASRSAHPGIGIETIGERIVRLIPSKKVDINKPSTIYNLQIKELAKQA